MSGVLLVLAYTALFLQVIRRWSFFSVPGLPKLAIAGVFLLKIAAGTALWWVYTYHYTDRATADIHKYFDDGNVMFSALSDRPMDYLRMMTGTAHDTAYFDLQYFKVMNNWYRQYEGAMYNDAHTMIRYNALVRLFSFGNYHVHTVFSCFLGLVGLTALYKAFVPYAHGLRNALFASIFLLPSVLFWGSGALKESLLLFAIGPLVASTLRIAERRTDGRAWALLIGSVLLLTILKIYVLAALVPGLVALTWNGVRNTNSAWWRFALTTGVIIMIGWRSDLVVPGFNVLEVIRVKQKDMIDLVAHIPTGSYVYTEKLQATMGSFLLQAPHALYLSFLSPFLMAPTGAFGLLTAAENVLLFVALFLALRYAKRRSDIDLPLVLFCGTFVLILALIIGWTTPVVGALVRYRVPLLPFHFLMCLLIIDPRRLPAWLLRPLS